MNMKTIYFTLFMLIFSSGVFAGSNDVATVVQKRGIVRAQLANGIIIPLSTNDKVPEGAVISTASKSFIKLVFIDKSQMNIGPLSQVLIQAFPTKDAGILKLIKGQIRAKVTKNYMEMDDKSKSKLFIQTKTASMGIRGTDFQVNYNPESDNSSLIVFEGKVAMGHIDNNLKNAVLDQKRLEEIVSNPSAVMVKQGQISVVNFNIASRALLPTKLAPKQFEALKVNQTGIEDKLLEKKSDDSKFRDVIPPGVDGSAFINAPVEEVKTEIKDAFGFRNDATGEFKPAAGTIIDLKTVNIISPPPNATFDANTKTFQLTENYGKINEKSGQYIPPEGYELSTQGQFQPVIVEAVKPVDRTEDKRGERKADRVADKQTDNKEDRQDNKQADQQPERQVDRVADRTEERSDSTEKPQEVISNVPTPVLKIPETVTRNDDSSQRPSAPVAAAPSVDRPAVVAPIVDRPVVVAPVNNGTPTLPPVNVGNPNLPFIPSLKLPASSPGLLPGVITPAPVPEKQIPIFTPPTENHKQPKIIEKFIDIIKSKLPENIGNKPGQPGSKLPEYERKVPNDDRKEPNDDRKGSGDKD